MSRMTLGWAAGGGGGGGGGWHKGGGRLGGARAAPPDITASDPAESGTVVSASTCCQPRQPDLNRNHTATAFS